MYSFQLRILCMFTAYIECFSLLRLPRRLCFNWCVSFSVNRITQKNFSTKFEWIFLERWETCDFNNWLDFEGGDLNRDAYTGILKGILKKCLPLRFTGSAELYIRYIRRVQRSCRRFAVSERFYSILRFKCFRYALVWRNKEIIDDELIRRWLQLRFDCDSTARQPFDDLHHDCVCGLLLWSINNKL